MWFYPCDRVRFRFVGNDKRYDMIGTVVDDADFDDEQCVWFLADEKFEVPRSWEADANRPGQFITLTKYLSPFVDERLSELDVGDLL